MKRTTTQISHADRIARVADHIAAHLDTPLGLDRLAEVACFSPYHFHRTYRHAMGETVDQTVRRLRLHRAATALVQSAEPLARIAARAGYGSQDTFARAFVAAYGQTPARYRADRCLVPVELPSAMITETTAMNRTYTVTVKLVAPIRLAGLPHVGPYPDIGGTYGRLMALAGPQGLLGGRCVALYFDDPETIAPAALRSFAGLEIGADTPVAPPVETMTMPAGPVASVIHKGPYAELPAAFRHLYGEWLPASGREPADRPSYEVYLNDPQALPPAEWLTEVCLPLLP